MPFTPLHMGPGIAIKALLQGSFSLMVFGWSQIVIDIQPLIVLIAGEGHVHGFTHTYVGAALTAVIAALTGKPLSQIGLYILGLNSQWEVDIKWRVAFLSAFIGTFSHVLLDSIMHADVEPLYPFSSDNAMLNTLSVASMHMLCVYSGLLGGVVFLGVSLLRKAQTAGRSKR